MIKESELPEQVYQVGHLQNIKPDDLKFNTLGECVKHLMEEDERYIYGIWDMTDNSGELVGIVFENRYFKAF